MELLAESPEQAIELALSNWGIKESKHIRARELKGYPQDYFFAEMKALKEQIAELQKQLGLVGRE